MSALNAALNYAEDHKQELLDDLVALLKIPSISTLPEHEGDIERAGTWIVDRLTSLGFEKAGLLPTQGHPVVYGEYLKAGSDAPTILIYGHYDVQPPDPLDEWVTEPFNPQVRDDNIYARGASDMKGQMVANLRAVEAMVRSEGLPLNIKYMLEGEEEIGSPNLSAFISENADLLASDFCLNCDSMIQDPETPSITYTLRGLGYFEIRLQGAKSDLHSGMFGGAIDNPANVLTELIAGMRDKDGRITIPGFYENVRPLTEAERQEMVSKPDSWWLEQTGAKSLFGDEEYSANERATARPTFDVNGLLSGFTGEGSKTVLPAKAMAKISMRLVPDQRPEEIEEKLRAYLTTNAPPTVSWELENLSSCLPSISERDSESVRAAIKAFDAVWGKKPVFTRQGGSVPVVGLIQDLLGVESLIMGFGLPDDNLHAPNEKQYLPNLYRGIETYIHFMHEIAEGI
jgi:acetylornithine deacetylase/succinyl-diaminopimelate desuccinylase-like protein